MSKPRPALITLPLLAALALSAGPAPVAAQAPPPDLADPEIAHVAVTANAIDVEAAELARDRASDAEVVGFARTMITDHTAVNVRAAALAERLGVTPADNPVSRSLRADAASQRSRLAALRAADFDRAYMEREVAYHQAVLDALDDVLIPQADNAELKGLLVEVRPAIAAHLEHAQALAARLARQP